MVTTIIPTSAPVSTNFERAEISDAERALLAGIAEILARPSCVKALKKKTKAPGKWKALTEQQIRFIEAYRGCSIQFLEEFAAMLDGVPTPTATAVA
jgi:hypothetical protein